MKAIIRLYAGTCKRKEAGPGRGWWGPPKGTHTAQNAPGGGEGIQATKVGSVGVPKGFSSADYVDAQMWNDLGIDSQGLPVVVASAVSQLPPVPEGHTRFYHGTNIRNAQSILEKGILTGREANSKERLPVVLGTTDGPSQFGSMSFVSDLPSSRVRQVNDSWAEVGASIPRSSLTGIVVGRQRVNSSDIPAMKRLITLYTEYDKLKKE